MAKKHGISPRTAYNWYEKDKCRDESDQKKDLKALKEELYEANLQNQILKDLLKKHTKYGFILGENRFFFLLAFIDVFTREPMDYYIGKSCKAIQLENAFENALRRQGILPTGGLVIRSDDGPQMTSNLFRTYINELNAEHEFIPPEASNKNAHVESFFSIYELEFL